MIITRPILYSSYSIQSYMFREFPAYLKKDIIISKKYSPAIDSQTNNAINNFLTHVESLVSYRNFFTEVEKLSGETKTKITVNYNINPYNFTEPKYKNIIQDIYRFYRPNTLGGAWYSYEVDKISKDLYHIFSSNIRTGEIFINGQKLTDFRINIQSLDCYERKDIEIEIDTMHISMRAVYPTQERDISETFIEEIVEYK